MEDGIADSYSQCNGHNPCDRCQLNNNPCIYEPFSRQTKTEMREELSNLRRYKEQTEHILEGLASGKDTQLILSRLRNGKPIEHIYRELEKPAAATYDCGKTEFEGWPLVDGSPLNNTWSWPQMSRTESRELSEVSSQQQTDHTSASSPFIGEKGPSTLAQISPTQTEEHALPYNTVWDGAVNAEAPITNLYADFDPQVVDHKSWATVSNNPDLMDHHLDI